MRALLTDGAESRLHQSAAEPEAGEGEAVIRPTRVLVDLEDEWIARSGSTFTGVIGRFAVGVVEDVHSAGAAVRPGQRVIVSPASSCRQCEFCQRGLSPHCRRRTILGQDGRDGCLAERFVAPLSSLQSAPEALDDDHAVFAAPLAAALHAARQLTIEGRPYITVLGDSLPALLTVQVMARLNASVRLIGWQADVIGRCEKWGIKHRLAPEVGRRGDQDVIMLCAGNEEAWDAAVGMARPRGAILVKSPVPAPVSLAGMRSRELTLIGSFFGGLAEGVSALQRGEIDVVSLIARRMRLADGPEILRAAARPETIAVMVEP